MIVLLKRVFLPRKYTLIEKFVIKLNCISRGPPNLARVYVGQYIFVLTYFVYA